MKIRDFEKDYQERGSYHYSLQGFKEWFLVHNYQKLVENIPQEASVTDVGCGEGRICEFLPKSCKYVGYDIAQTGIVLAREKFPGHEFVHGRFEQGGTEKSSQDYVLSSLTLQYLSKEELKRVFGKTAEVLKDTGILRFTYPTILRGISEDSNKLPLQALLKMLNNHFGKIDAKCLCHLVDHEHTKDAGKVAQMVFEKAILNEEDLSNAYHYIIECSN